MKKLVSVSIGIPAYNESQNIQRLLSSLLKQKEVGIKIKEILVISDGSTDDTRLKVAALKDKRVTFIDDGKRLGKSARLDYIMKTFTGEVLVLTDADIMITDPLVLSKTVKNAKLSQSGIAGINALPLPAQTYFENVVEAGVMIMKNIAARWNGGNNYLSFKGCYLALDGALARSIHIPASIVNNDPYLYFSALEKGYTPAYIPDVYVYYRSPMNLIDHIKQSSRYQSSRVEMEKYFNLDWNKQYTMPTTILIGSIIKSMISRPLFFFPYIAVNVISKIHKQTNIKSTWSIASSTKGKISL